MGTAKLKLKILVDKVGQKVLYAEVGKDVVDFMFSFLAPLSLTDVIRLLSKQSKVGCLGKLYKSMEDLENAYLQQGDQDRGVLLRPMVASPGFIGNAAKKEDSGPETFYRCSYHPYYSDDVGAICPSCRCKMDTRMEYVPPPAGGKVDAGSTGAGADGGGFVKSDITYMVMDDLTVTPMSTISSITLLNKSGVKEANSLEERVMQLDMNEAREMLNTSLKSTSVLTDLFLSKSRK